MRSNSVILSGFRDEDVMEKFRKVCEFLGVGEIVSGS